MSAILAGGMLGSSLIGAGSQKRQNEANQEYATKMASTQYQRAVEDMRAAGINPVMAAGNGGAAAPTVQGQAPGAGVAENLMGAAKTLAVDLPQAKADIANTETQTRIGDQEVKNRKAQEQLIKAQTKATQVNAQSGEYGLNKAKAKSDAWGVVSSKSGAIAEGAKAGIKNITENPKGAWDRYTAPFRQTPGNAYATGQGAVYGGSHSAKSGKSH